MDPEEHLHQYDPSTILELLSSNFGTVQQKDNNNLTVYLDSGIRRNGHIIKKYVTFNSNLSLCVKIGNIVVDMKHHYMSDSYNLNKNSIDCVIKEMKLLEVCRGTPLKKKQEYKRSKNVLEEILSFENNENGHRVLRSTNCHMVANFIGKGIPRCKSCQRMVINYIPEQSGHGQNEESPLTLLKKLMPSASKNFMTFIIAQIQNSQSFSSKSRKWDKCIVSECLNLFTRSPQGYVTLRNSGLMQLPSPNLLICYKNKVVQKPGYDNNVFEWMHREAERLNIPKEGRIGGLVLDEMAIQESIEIVQKGKSMEIVGFTEMGEEGDLIQTLRNGKHKQILGSHILQLLFQGLTGFRFPIAHFVSAQVNACELYSIVWEAIDKLQQFNFVCKYVCMDGASSNRSFLHMHFPNKDAEIQSFTTHSPINPLNEVYFLMDPSHCFKKIRNNILKSGIKKGCTRILTLSSGEEIHWDMWMNAFRWDQTNPIQIHKRLTNEHMFPSQSSKMRNKLAEDALDDEMLNLMTAYRANLGLKGKELDGAVDLLRNTSKMISIFRDRRPIHMIEDIRLETIREVQKWFQNWTKGINENTKGFDKGKSLMSRECQEDIQSCLLGFEKLVVSILHEYHGWSIIPAMINSDQIENQFCQHRGKLNGANTNPTALQYRRNINSVILGESAVSKKSNCFRKGENCKSYSFTTSKQNPQNLKRKLSTNASCFKAIKCIRL